MAQSVLAHARDIDPPTAAQPAVQRDLLTVAEAAERLHITPRSAWKLVWSNDPDRRLESVKLGSRVYVPALSVTAYVRKLCRLYGATDTYDLLAG